ncbi:5-methylcytosine rRNA methyltransferase NSUN4 [Trichoplusia ni]|uniref:NOL1/NOP2/Sun domain family member 4 n=1 Tax=Trichoplusia ni TaxID=7111 RepID=A0A7E5W576_TRINI|nr:5-methylcytosine rRNA methyltransferase NSUN4 [Trichoplusia ni]
MLNISNIYRNACVSTYIAQQVRFKTKIHWAKLKKKTGPKYKALNHFDEFYGSVFGNKWQPMREALLRRSKYVAVVNNYGDTEKTMDELTNRGAHCLKKLISVQQEYHKQYDKTPPEVKTEQQSPRIEAFMERQRTEEISNIYPNADNIPEKLDIGGEEENFLKKKKEPVAYQNRTLEESIAEAKIDESRIIDPSLGITSESLYQFLPATKLKGMDDWVPESQHYSYFSKDNDFPLVIEPEAELNYPEHLKVYTYEMDSESTSFPEPKRSQTGVYNYYPMDCGSVLAVLALGLNPGDRVLDLCSAPGGKALVALQTLLPDVIICNDVSISRSNRTQKIFRDYLIDFETSNKWRERVILKRVDGRNFVDDHGFDKVLVDVPCTTDRHSVNEDENNMFRPDRIKERLRIPEMQSQLLVNALKLAKVGGTVVYSTCSLSPIQNDGVVHMALKYAFETHGLVAAVKDLTIPMVGFSSTLVLGSDSARPKYGQLVTPSIGANFGPSYIAKLVRVR